MKYIIGLGNPGTEYQKNRHNVGFMILDKLVEFLKVSGEFTYNKKFKAEVLKSGDYLFIKPMDFMNNSGQATRAVIDFYEKNFNLADVFVMHDDLDIEVGQFKIQQGKGPKVHNGLIDLNKHLNSENYWHIRIGVDGRGGDRSIPGSSYVLSNFNVEEKEMIDSNSEKLLAEIKVLIEN
jgi:peptidyl-tRNA hydrolase, PTH1 family